MKTKSKNSFAMALFVIAIIGMNYEAKANEIAVKIIWTPTCENWLIRTRHVDTNEMYWLVAYISGLAEANSQILGKDLLEDVGAKDIFRWMDNYCIANPNSDIGYGGRTYVNEIVTLPPKNVFLN
jgi:hypothetical protein